jgi:hypothetical protein
VTLGERDDASDGGVAVFYVEWEANVGVKG